MINAPWYNDAVERTAFNAYAMSETFYGRSKSDSYLESIAKELVDNYHSTGRTSFDLSATDLTDADIAYIQERFNHLA